ncbi:MAG: hypothetical protein ACI8RD_013389 [Bacillariaceae sp.]|jgi:hypothetical protein
MEDKKIDYFVRKKYDVDEKYDLRHHRSHRGPELHAVDMETTTIRRTVTDHVGAHVMTCMHPRSD